MVAPIFPRILPTQCWGTFTLRWPARTTGSGGSFGTANWSRSQSGIPGSQDPKTHTIGTSAVLLPSKDLPEFCCLANFDKSYYPDSILLHVFLVHFISLQFPFVFPLLCPLHFLRICIFILCTYMTVNRHRVIRVSVSIALSRFQ